MEEYLKKLNNQIDNYVTKYTEIINKIGYLDSILKQLNLQEYNIEEHIVNEFNLRLFIQNELNQNRNQIKVGEDIIIFEKNQTITFDETKENNETEENKKTRFTKLKRLYESIILKKNNPKLYKSLSNELKPLIPYESITLEFKNPPDNQIKNKFEKMFFNKNDYTIYFVENGVKRIITEEKEFLKIIQLLIFSFSKKENFDKPLNSIIEPLYINPFKILNFLDYNKGREYSKDIISKFLEEQEKQKDITSDDHKQIKQFMDIGFEELKNAQNAIYRLNKKNKNSLKNVKYIQLIKRPYLVHLLMVYMLKIAIFAEARSKPNKYFEFIYTGRESGFEGGNTVAIHGLNNHLKFKTMLNLIQPTFEEYKKLFRHIDVFKSWLLMSFHDIATYDRQNSISFGIQQKYKNDNKNAHKIIGSYIFKENKIIKEIFDSDIEEIKKELNKDLNHLSNIIKQHDYKKVHFDLNKLHSQGLNTDEIKELLHYSISGIADNSAGIAFLDEDNEVKVDPLEEKGSSIFFITEKAQDVKKSNAEIFCYMIEKMSKDEDYFKTEKGKKEFKLIKEDIKKNINNVEDEVIKNKLLERFDSNFSPFSAQSILGVINSGFIKFVKYDSQTLKINIIMDFDFNNKIEEISNKKYVYKRIIKFLEEYEDDFVKPENPDNKKKNDPIEHLIKKGSLKIYNSDKDGNQLKTIGLEIEIIEMRKIKNMTLIEDYSKKLSEVLKNYEPNQEYITEEVLEKEYA